MTAQFLLMFISSKYGVQNNKASELLRAENLGFGYLMVGTEHSADLGINWHLSLLREKGQIMMLL